MRVREIVLHVSPDLDGMVGAWLLKRFGEPRFPGASAAPVRFLPVSAVDGPALETDGVVAVDVGGGRFDHHQVSSVKDANAETSGDGPEGPRASADCATTLVARELRVDTEKRLKKILDLVRRRDIEGVGVRSSDPLDQVAHLSNLIDGWNGLHPNDPGRVLELTFACVDAIHANETAWEDALEEVAHGEPVRFPATGILVDWFESDNKRLMKASRFRRRDACVVRSGKGNTGVNVNFASPRVQVGDVTAAAIYLRLFECRARKILPEGNRLAEGGDHHGWFLHASRRLVMAGSDKEPRSEGSRLTPREVAELVGTSLHPDHLFPRIVCPGTHCLGPSCEFLYRHDLPNCAIPKSRGIAP